ncbi:MAG: MGMT family protein [Christensenellaceae bacterium]|jgi:methylated-DNA-protein-cysteine methyltransferase-like protein|nr:MGMT family protein [Christensenellaceae bacterium]
MFGEFYEVVKNIPKGVVMSYGQVAIAAGFPHCARQVGYALHKNPDPQNIPCHRVVFADGGLSKSFAFGGINRQRELLQSEGVRFIDEKVNMAECGFMHI